MKIDDLKAAPFNPRMIDQQAMRGLSFSLEEFGDLSGFTFNTKLGYLLTGHQRLDALKARHGDGLAIKDNWVTTPTGERYQLRLVDWDEPKSKAAMLASNTASIQGAWTSAIDGLVQEISDAIPDVHDALMLDQISAATKDVQTTVKANAVQNAEIADIELQPFEHYDFVLVLATNVKDWDALCERLSIKKVNGSAVGKKRIGLGRCVNASRVLALLK